MRVGFLAGALALTALQAQAATVHFCWQGENGYTMTGKMSFADDLLTAPLITEADVASFSIAGYRNGRLLGRWDMADRGPDTTWYLRYMPVEMRFPVNAEVAGPFDQGWNADGTAYNCGAGGFGFNAGNYAQDFCLDGDWIEESGMPPPTPFYAMLTPPPTPDCSGPMMLSKAARNPG